MDSTCGMLRKGGKRCFTGNGSAVSANLAAGANTPDKKMEIHSNANRILKAKTNSGIQSFKGKQRISSTRKCSQCSITPKRPKDYRNFSFLFSCNLALQLAALISSSFCHCCYLLMLFGGFCHSVAAEGEEFSFCSHWNLSVKQQGMPVVSQTGMFSELS